MNALEDLCPMLPLLSYLGGIKCPTYIESELIFLSARSSTIFFIRMGFSLSGNWYVISWLRLCKQQHRLGLVILLVEQNIVTCVAIHPFYSRIISLATENIR